MLNTQKMASSWSARQQNIKERIEAAERVLKSVSDEGGGNSSAEAGACSGFTETKYYYSKSPVRIKSDRRRPRAYVNRRMSSSAAAVKSSAISRTFKWCQILYRIKMNCS